MRQFLYLCLLGTALVGTTDVFAYESQYGQSRTGFDNLGERISNLFKSNEKSGSTAKGTSSTSTTASGSNSVASKLDSLQGSDDVSMDLTDSGSWTYTDKSGKVIGESGSNGGWYLDDSGNKTYFNSNLEKVDASNYTGAVTLDQEAFNRGTSVGGSFTSDGTTYVRTENGVVDIGNSHTWEANGNTYYLKDGEVHNAVTGAKVSDITEGGLNSEYIPKNSADAVKTTAKDVSSNDAWNNLSESDRAAIENGGIEGVDYNVKTPAAEVKTPAATPTTTETVLGTDASGNTIKRVETTTGDVTTVEFYKGNEKISASDSVRLTDPNYTSDGDFTTDLGRDVNGRLVQRVDTTTDGVTTSKFYVDGKEVSASDAVRGVESSKMVGTTPEAGSYTWKGEMDDGVLGMGKTQLYQDNKTGVYFTMEDGKVASAFSKPPVEVSAGKGWTVQTDGNGKSIMVSSDGKFATSFLEDGTAVGMTKGGQEVRWDGRTGSYQDQAGNTYTYNAENDTFRNDNTGEVVKSNGKVEEAEKAANEAKTAATSAAALPDKAVTQNAVEYGIVIAETVVANEKVDLTENTTVQGAEQVVASQGSTHESKIVSATKDDALSATTISSAANVMIALLQANPLDLTMLDDTACNTGTGSAGQGTTTAGAAVGGIDTTAYKKCIKNKRALFAQTVAVASQIIAEGSNAVSSKFYDRVNQLMTQANGQYTSEFADAHGSLGAISVVNDAERYPYFEMVRGSALSAVQLTAKGAENLVELDVEIKPEEGEGE